ncbi:MAG: hypothetical protein WBW62_05370 [Solirubrobacterales bacterium]
MEFGENYDMGGPASRLIALPGEPKLQVLLSEHAIERFRERFRPALSLAKAAVELRWLVGKAGTVSNRQPKWASIENEAAPDAFLTIGEDLILLLKLGNGRMTAVTCLCRGTIRKSERNKRRNGRRSRKHLSEMRRQRPNRQPVDWRGEAEPS